MKLQKPNSDKATILYHLIKYGSVSMKTFSWMEGYRTRVSELKRKHEIALNDKLEKTTNRFGRGMHYYEHHLVNKDHAIKVYEKINHKEKCVK